MGIVQLHGHTVAVPVGGRLQLAVDYSGERQPLFPRASCPGGHQPASISGTTAVVTVDEEVAFDLAVAGD